MIQPAAPTTLIAPALATEQVAAQPVAGAELADFGALLAIQVQGMEPAAEADPALPATTTSAAAATPFPATGKPDGKILPPGLPVAAPVAAPEEVAADSSPPVVPPRTVPVALPTALLKPRGTPANTPDTATVPGADEGAAEAEPVDPADPPALTAPPPPALPVLAVPVLLPEPGPAAAPAPGEPAAGAPPRLPVPPAQPAALPLPTAPVSIPPGAEPAANLRPETVVPVRAFEPVLADAPLAAETALAAPQSPNAAPPSSAPITAPSPTAQSLTDRPHDFTALVDRLVAAREALQPQSVTLAVRHTDFGAVQLRFQQDAGGLSVAMASADPDFARAVSAAVPPVPAATASDTSGSNTASFGQNGRGDSTGGAASDGSAQSRSGQQTQREERAHDRSSPRANPAESRGKPADGTSNQGIFA